MGITGIHAIPVTITCTLQGTLCNTGIPCTFYGGNICNVHILQSILLFKRNLLQPPGLKARNMSNPSGRYILCYLHSCLNFGWPQVLNWKGGHLAVSECVGTRYISMQKIDLFRFRFSPTVNKVATPKLKGNQPNEKTRLWNFKPWYIVTS